MKTIKSSIALAWLAMPLLAACAGTAESIKPVRGVDLSLFMGRWYVIASIPTRFERGGHNAVETYSRNADGTLNVAGCVMIFCQSQTWTPAR